MRNGYKIIDAHCHIYPDKISDKAAVAISRFYDGLHHTGGSCSELLELMERQGIDFAVVNSAALKPAQVDSINNFICQSVSDHPERFTGVGTLNPDSSKEDIDRQVRFLLDNHLHGIKIHNDMLRIPIDDSRMERIYSVCGEAGIPVLLHTGDRRYDFTNPNRMEPMAAKYKNVTFIGGHFGGRDVFTEAADKLSKYPNFFCDCSSSFDQMKPDTAMYCLKAYGINKVMFGTDYPVLAPNYDLDYLFSLKLDPAWLENILSKNVQRIYRFTAPWES